jgi:hypothetical protein
MWSNEQSTMAKTEKDAYIKDVIYMSKIQPNTVDLWVITVYNANCNATDNQRTGFFFKFYFGDELWLDEYNQTYYKIWECGVNETVNRACKIQSLNMMDPWVYDVKIELYWFDGYSSRIVDFITFKITITLLVPLQHIRVLSYLAAYSLVCLAALSFFYVGEYGIRD